MFNYVFYLYIISWIKLILTNGQYTKTYIFPSHFLLQCHTTSRLYIQKPKKPSDVLWQVIQMETHYEASDIFMTPGIKVLTWVAGSNLVVLSISGSQSCSSWRRVQVGAKTTLGLITLTLWLWNTIKTH